MRGNFLWGTATSAHQVEGGNRWNDWVSFERRFTPSGAACAFDAHFEADLDRARALGTNAFRFSLEWSRVEPEPGVHDPAAVSYYERLLRACRDRGLRPLLTLVHFTLPRWCPERRWLDPATLHAFQRHVGWVAERFGAEVDLFVTFNEPNVQAGAGYLSGVFPPGRRFRPDLAASCRAALTEAHALAYRTIHAVYARLYPGRDVAVGVSPHTVGWRPSCVDVGSLVYREGQRFNWSFLDAAHARDTLDFCGLNYFMGLKADPVTALRFAGLLRMKRGPTTSDMGWPMDSGSFEAVLLEAARRYGLPILVTENGVADADDRLRADYLKEHVAALDRAAGAGADVRGYFHWSLIDNFEWHAGYGPRFGLFHVDYDTQRRTPRPSSRVYRELIAARGGTSGPRPASTRPAVERAGA